MSRTIEAVVAGHICLDIIPTLASQDLAFEPGKMREVGPVVLSTGGAVSNTGLALHKLGIQTRLMGKVGADQFGQIVLDIVRAHGSDLAEGIIRAPGEVTAYTLVLSPRGAGHMFLHCPGCNDTFGADDVDYDTLKAARLFHFGYPPLMKRLIERSGAELADVFMRARATGVTASLDMCMPDLRGYAGAVDWPEVISTTLPCVDIYLPSLEETLVMLGPDKYQAFVEKPGGLTVSAVAELLPGIATELLSMGPAIIGLKLGRMGLYLRTGTVKRLLSMGRARPSMIESWAERELWSPCFKADVVGTTGAGDAAIAGFFAALLRGQSPKDCMTMACAVGACNVEAADALSGLLSWEQTQARLQAGWARSELPLDQAGWKKDARTGVWRSSTDSARAADN